jgi:hypothetical protein
MHIGKSMVARVTSSFFRLLILVEVEFDGGGGGEGETEVVVERRGSVGGVIRRWGCHHITGRWFIIGGSPNLGFGVAGGHRLVGSRI